MNELVTDASVWSGKELVNRSDWLHELTDQEITELTTAVDTTNELSLTKVHRDTFRLPLLAHRLKQFSIHSKMNQVQRSCGAFL